MTIRLVRIDCKEFLYHAYEGKTHVNTIRSDAPLEADFIEYFRVYTDKVMESLDEQEPTAA